MNMIKHDDIFQGEMSVHCPRLKCQADVDNNNVNCLIYEFEYIVLNL
jgi:hypothetical protein